MFRRVIAAAGLCSAMLAGSVTAAPDPEALLREEVLAATWPADIVRLAGDYRRRFPRAPGAGDVAARGAAAARARAALETKDVNLPRDAFVAAAALPALRADAERALLADAAAAGRIAHAYRDGGADVAAEPLRYLAWLHYAAALGGPEANYELSRHYRDQGQMPMAAKYQSRAVELGVVLPRELDSVRK
ncbi:MAG: hypothetical protein KF788_06520 [Piscinibacter sp.]|nr:hypothetical protein [Piscinibacter sp.]